MNEVTRMRLITLTWWAFAVCVACLIFFAALRMACGAETNKLDVAMRLVKNPLTHEYEPQALFQEHSNRTYYFWLNTDRTFTNWSLLFPFPETPSFDQTRGVGLPPRIYGPVAYARVLEVNTNTTTKTKLDSANMTNLLGTLTVCVCTSFVNIGTYTPTGGTKPTHNVERAQIVTNTYASFVVNGVESKMLLKSEGGPALKERLVEMPPPLPLVLPMIESQPNGKPHHVTIPVPIDNDWSRTILPTNQLTVISNGHVLVYSNGMVGIK